MNQRNVCIVGLAAVVTVLAGCAAQYRDQSACVAEMRSRLDGTSKGELKVTHRAVSYRGSRVVIEGELQPASGATAASAPAAASAAGTSSDAQTPATALAAAGTESAPAASTSPMTSTTSRPASGSPQAATASAAVAASAPASASAPVAASAPAKAAASAQPKPTTPVGRLLAHFSHAKRKTTATAAECTFGDAGLTSFRWLAPADLAKTTPAPAHGS